MRDIEVYLADEDPRRRRKRVVAAVAMTFLALLAISKGRVVPKSERNTPIPTIDTSTTSSATTSTSTPPPPTQPAHLAAIPASLTFPSQMAGVASAAQLVRVRNEGDLPLTVGHIAAQGVAFRVTSDCNAALQKSESCSAAIVFVSDVSGPRHGTLIIDTDGGNAAVDLRGTTTAIPTVDLGPIQFGSVAVGGTSEPSRSVRFVNSGAVPIALDSSRSAPPFFADDGCANRVIPPGGNCIVQIGFHPADPGFVTGALSLLDVHDKVVAQSTLSGTGFVMLEERPKISIEPRSIRFYAGKSREVITIANIGLVPVHLAIHPDQKPRGYLVDAGACEGKDLMPRESCKVIVIATPIALQSREAMRLVVDYPGGSELTSIAAR